MATIKVIKEHQMNTLYKQDGTKIEINDNSLEFALKLGWTLEEPSNEKPAKKQTEKAAKKAN